MPENNVTLTDVCQSAKRQSALLGYKVRNLLLTETGELLGFPRWVTVEVLERVGDEVTVANVTSNCRPSKARIYRCRGCSAEYADTARKSALLCRDCERARDNELQNRRRLREKSWTTLSLNCHFCGVKLNGGRVGQKFCGTSCRVAAHRAKGH